MIGVKKLRENAILPTRATPGSAGVDLYACLDGDIVIHERETKVIPLGFAMAIPEGYVGLIFARSGLATKSGLAPANKVAVMDSDYRGEWFAPLLNHGDVPRVIHPGERVAQLVIVPCLVDAFELVDELPETERGEGGFGSTGK